MYSKSAPAGRSSSSAPPDGPHATSAPAGAAATAEPAPKVALSAAPTSRITAATDAFSRPERSGAMFMLSTAPWPTVARYASKTRDAFAWPRHTQSGSSHAPSTHAHSCQNQNVGTAPVLPSGPSCIVMPCSSVGWKYPPSSLGAAQPEVSAVELGAGPALVYSERVDAHTSPRYGEMSVAGDSPRMSSYTAGHRTAGSTTPEPEPSNQKRLTGPYARSTSRTMPSCDARNASAV